MISYRTLHTGPDGFAGEISITARSASPDGEWWLSFRYPGVRITWMAGARWYADGGDTVTVEPSRETPAPRDGTLLPIVFTATGRPAAPSGCLFEGARCHIAG